jgi:hypothetical protein
MDNSCPCIDCVCFPICKNKVKYETFMSRDGKKRFKSIDMSQLVLECILFRDWWQNQGGMNSDSHVYSNMFVSAEK